jgi:hypothetical protein
VRKLSTVMADGIIAPHTVAWLRFAPPSFVVSAAAVSEATCSRSSTAMRGISVALTQGVRLYCPSPSTLNSRHPPHSQAHHNFIARRLICDYAMRKPYSQKTETVAKLESYARRDVNLLSGDMQN